MAYDDDSNESSAAYPIATALVALGFIALTALIFWRATSPGQDFDKIWAATGAIIGVVVGAIPSFFFQRQIRTERSRSAVLGDRATALAATSSADSVKEAIKIAPHAFG